MLQHSANALELKINTEAYTRAPLITIRAEKQPLQAILKRLTGFGITVRIDPTINPIVSANVSNFDIQKGLKSILKEYNTVFIWKSIDSPNGKILMLSEIQVFKSGQQQMIQPLNRNDILLVAKNPKDGSYYVKNELLIRFKSDISFSEFNRIISGMGGTVTDVDPITGVYRLRFPEEIDVLDVLEKNRNLTGIAKIEPNYAYRRASPINISDVSSNLEHELSVVGIKGKVPIAILDSGFIQDSNLKEFVIASLDAFQPDQPISDSQGHGTQMAMIASGIVNPYGVRSDTEISPVIPIKALDENGMTSNFIIMQSIEFALKNGAKVMSLSWGTETKSEFLEQALDHAVAKGLIIVASAGNEPTGKPVYPAAYPSVVGVGALKPDGNIWEKSNYGNFVSMYAPGVASFPVGYNGPPGTYVGTSISAAYVSHLIANYLSKNPNATSKDIINQLIQNKQKPHE